MTFDKDWTPAAESARRGRQSVSKMNTMRKCIMCLAEVEMPLVNKCSKCFFEGRKRQPPRQSGRTHAAIMAMKPGQVYAVHCEEEKLRLSREYSRRGIRFENVKLSSRWLPGLNAKDLQLDHAVWDIGMDPCLHDALESIGYFKHHIVK